MGTLAAIHSEESRISAADILLLCNVLTALDGHTAQWIVEKCLKGDLIKGRTVNLVSHDRCRDGQSSRTTLWHSERTGTLRRAGPLMARSAARTVGYSGPRSSAWHRLFSPFEASEHNTVWKRASRRENRFCFIIHQLQCPNTAGDAQGMLLKYKHQRRDKP